MKHVLIAAVIGTATLLASGSVLAQAKPDTLVKQRQSAMTLIGKYFGPMGGMAAGKVPYNADVVKRNTAYLDALSKMPWDGFTPGTQEIKSRALPAVYSDAAKFKEAQDHFTGEVTKLVATVSGGDEGAIKAQLGALGKSCGGCHQGFREK
ncbi:MAG: cytochrome c [Burkholderiales bacterium]|nr:cytochrome c [Burkholderiales bacterium]